MKKITIPTDQELLELLSQTSKNIQEYSEALSQYPKPHDTIHILKLIKKSVVSILKKTNN